MATLSLFSKRQKQLRGEVADVYVYDSMPRALRVQIIHIWRETIGSRQEYKQGHYVGTARAYHTLVQALRREYGVFQLVDAPYADQLEELETFVLTEVDVEKVLDAVELSLRLIDTHTRSFNHLTRNDASARADAAIEEINLRFREHGVGYQFAAGEIIRIDSELLHAEAVKPALLLLQGKDFAGAQAEFLTAYEHYRHGRSKEALVDALKALESVMKVICAKNGWPHEPGATASKLLQVLFDKELIPAFWQTHFSALRSTLESGVPTVRNKAGGHGQGAEVIDVPPHIVAFALHSTASAILLITQAERASVA